MNVFLVLNNIRSAYNVGAILRTAEAAGVKRVFLCGCTPDPKDRFGRKRKDIAKTALGAEEIVAWEHCDDIRKTITTLKEEGIRVVALEQDERSVPYTTIDTKKPTAIVLGEEVYGLSQDVLDTCDAVAEIPMRGSKESLNVSVAAGIILFSLLK